MLQRLLIIALPLCIGSITFAQGTPPQDLPREDLPREDLPREDLPPQQLPTGELPPQELPPGRQRDPADQFADAPWPVRLGMRVHQVDEAFALIDRVVLVPDAATYVDELARWSPAGRWPVLIEDNHLAPMFIRRFKPAQVIRRQAVEQEDITRDRLEGIVTSTWGGRPERHAMRDAFAANNYQPVGVVVASLEDPAWPAAVALAAGRGQVLLWIEQRSGNPDAVTDQAAAWQFMDNIQSAVAAAGYEFGQLGENLDTITICRATAGRVNLPRWDNNEPEPAAMTDFLGRRRSGERFAFAGWIFGDETRSAYMAMCSLFLSRVHVTMYDTYGEGEPWETYDMTAATAVLSERGCEVSHLQDRRTSEASWLGMLAGGVEADVFVMNSHGNARELNLSTGKVFAVDVPLLNTPAALHLTHSWSLRAPDASGTIGGRWMDRGVYAYVGSVHEPYLTAFLPPTVLAQRWMSGVPFLIAARHWQNQQPFGGPWKVNTIGDPLMLMLPPQQFTKQRVEQPADYGQDLHEHAAKLMRSISDDPTGQAAAEAIALLDLLGRDEIALPLWKLAEQSSRAAAAIAAPAALGPLFRARDVDGFLRAWSLVDGHDDRVNDMLWHLITPRLATIRDDDLLLRLQASIRRDMPHIDLTRLAPHLARAFGNEHVRQIVDREVNRTSNERLKRQLQAVMGEL